MNQDEKRSTSTEYCNGNIENRSVYCEGDDGKEIIGIVGPSSHNATTIAKEIAKALREMNFIK